MLHRARRPLILKFKTMKRSLLLLSAAAVAVAGFSYLRAGDATSRAARPKGSVTFTKDIAPVVFNNCTGCHRPGQAAPFAFMNYEDVKKRGALIAGVTKARYMPPWHAAAGFGEFMDERRLSDEQIALIGQWVKDGMPEGDPSQLPALPKFPEGWLLGKPDLVVTMPQGFDIPASGPDIYRNFVIPLNLTEDKWVRAVEYHPGTRKVVHHCLFSYDATGALRKKDGADGRPGFGGMGAGGAGVTPTGANATRGGGMPPNGSLGGWAVGGTAVPLSDGLAYPLPKGADLVLQTHFHPTGKPEKEVSTVGIYFADKAPERTLMGVQLPAVFGIGTGLHIKAGVKDYTIRESTTLPVDMRIYAAGAHAHYLAKNMKMAAWLPDGKMQPLLWIPDWDFAWQDRYRLKQPLVLPKGTRIDVEISYDNTAENRHQPSNPPKDVWWGEGSFDEMGSMSLLGVCVNKEDEPVLGATLRQASREAIMNAVKDGTVARLRLGPQ
jgi:mono/diheme cytochrome c family protein